VLQANTDVMPTSNGGASVGAGLQMVIDGAANRQRRCCKLSAEMLQMVIGGATNVLRFCYLSIIFLLQCLGEACVWRVFSVLFLREPVFASMK
jgi:hypothetical protein